MTLGIYACLDRRSLTAGADLAHAFLVALSELLFNIWSGILVLLVEGLVLGHGIKFIISLFSLLSLIISSVNESLSLRVIGKQIKKYKRVKK